MTTNELSSRLKETQEKAHQELAALGTLEALEAWRVAYLGRHGALTALLRSLSGLPPEARRDAGALGNQAKAALEAAFALREAQLKASALAHAEARGKLDVTLPGTPFTLGRLHPTTQILREICGAFSTMGFQVVEGPEVEWDEYNFEKLNIPRDHPARDMWNTLWVDYQDPEGQPPARTGGQPPAQTGGQRQMLLRTHTSPMQARVMEKTRPPIRVVVPGRCYRYEATDATHEWQFTQVEGLAVDDGITFADMKGTLYEFARRIFGPERKVR
ncbi:MAG: phenylalanine--tRNA ligase subunit alpha, partial [Chloroflexota bacterium]|nr:phenylalanine--tRNA ligase subunit alpha [Chloroflexota bacterium]